MAQQASEGGEESTERAASPECSACGDSIPGVPYHPMRDLRRNADGAFVAKSDADGPFCDVTCFRNYERVASSEGE